MSILALIIVIIGILAAISLYLFVGFLSACFVGDNTDMTTTKVVFITLFWVPIFILGMIESLFGIHIINNWLFNKKDESETSEEDFPGEEYPVEEVEEETTDEV